MPSSRHFQWLYPWYPWRCEKITITFHKTLLQFILQNQKKHKKHTTPPNDLLLSEIDRVNICPVLVHFVALPPSEFAAYTCGRWRIYRKGGWSLWVSQVRPLWKRLQCCILPALCPTLRVNWQWNPSCAVANGIWALLDSFRAQIPRKFCAFLVWTLCLQGRAKAANNCLLWNSKFCISVFLPI